MDVDYNFCKTAKLIPIDLLVWLDLNDTLDPIDELYSQAFFGRNMMIIDDAIRISCVHKDFDRWANSEEMWFDISKRGDKRDFIDWVFDQRMMSIEHKGKGK
jgi:hypothetical protein